MSKPIQVLWSNNDYEIRPAASNDEFRDLWWSFMQSLGWDRGYYDLDTYMNPSLGSGMILLIEKATSKPVGHVVAVVNPNKTGWVAMFIIDEKHRGKGLGRELFKAVEADFERNGTVLIGLDGVVEQKQTYERRRFVSSPLGTVRFMTRNLHAKEPLPTLSTNVRLVDIRSVPKELLVQHELKYTGFERPALWSEKHMFHRKDLHGIAACSKRNPKKVDELLAWAVTRRCSSGIRIGPVYASDEASARAVLLATMRSVTPATIKAVPLPNEAMNDWSEEEVRDEANLVAEVWSGNADAVKVFAELGWKYSGTEYHRMWVDGKAPSEQSIGGASQRGVYAIFDAAVG